MSNERKNNRELIPFEIKRIPDTDLPEGDELVLIPGQEGLRVWREDGSLKEETDPVTEVVAYGPKSRVVPSGEIRQVNNELDPGVEKVVAEGFTGLQLVAEDGEVVEEYPPVPAKIEYGPLRQEVSFETIRRPNNDLEEGEESVIVSGKPGLELVDEEGNKELVKEPRTEEIEYGPKRIPLSFKVERRPNSDLAEGDFRVVTSGENGLELEDEEGNKTLVSEPVSEVVEYGPARIKLPFDTVRRPNSDLAEGKEEVVTAGSEGLQLEDEEGNTTLISEPVTEVIEYGPIRNFIPYDIKRVSNPELAEGEEKRVTPGVKGVQLEDEEGTITPASDPITEVIEYGPVRHPIPYETKRVSTPDLKEGDERVVTAGVEGLELEDEEGNMTLVSEPVTEVIEYGPIRIFTPYDIKRVSNPELEEGEEKRVTPGVKGVQLEDEEGTVTLASDPITEVIEYGPVRIPVAYETVRRVNTELKQGEEQVVTKGEEGLRLKDERGEITTVKDPVTEEIEYGPTYRILVHETIRIPHPDLAEDEEITLAKGINGLQLVDETGEIVEQYDSYPEEIAYGPDDEERKELKEKEGNPQEL